MKGVTMYITIETLWKKHKNKSLIARLTSHNWKTVAKKIKEIEQEKYPKKKPHPRILDSCKEQIIKYLEENLSAVRIHEKLQEEGIKVGYSTVKDYIGSIKKRDNIFIRIQPFPERKLKLISATPDIPLSRAKRERPGSSICACPTPTWITTWWSITRGWRPLSIAIIMPLLISVASRSISR